MSIVFSNHLTDNLPIKRVGININHPCLLESIKNFTAKCLQVSPGQMEFQAKSVRSLNVHLIPYYYKYEIFQFAEARIILLRTRYYSALVPQFLSIAPENVFHPSSADKFWEKLEKPNLEYILYHCSNKTELSNIRNQFLEKHFEFLQMGSLTLPPDKPIYLHEIIFKVDSIMVNFFFVERIEDLGSKNITFIERKVVETMGNMSIFSYNCLNELKEYLDNHRNSSMVTFGNRSGEENP